MVTEVNTEEMYKIIKRQNGESFAKVLRQNVLLDIPNLKHILEFAGTDPTDAEKLVPVVKKIREKSGKAKEIKQEEDIKDPIELLSEAGYDAFIVKNEIQKNSIKKYYRKGEELCTFHDPVRHEEFYIIHAVKRGADKIKPSDLPQREDEYGTSVISIQIAKTGGFISIKNRYNHTVNNPDATFDNNPDNIIPGLNEALKHKFGVDWMTFQDARLPENYRVINDQIVRFNYEICNVYYGDKYYFKGSEITKLSSEYEVILDAVILDTRTGKCRVHKDMAYNGEAGSRHLMDTLNNEISGHSIKITKDKKTGETLINIVDENKNIKELARTKRGCITSLHLYITSEIYGDLLEDNDALQEFYAPKVKRVPETFFGSRNDTRKINLRKLYVPELEFVGDFCFLDLISLQELEAPKLKRVRSDSFNNMSNLKQLYVPELEEIEKRSFLFLMSLKELKAPKLRHIGDRSFGGAEQLEKIDLPELEFLDDCFTGSKSLREVNVPKLKITEYQTEHTPEWPKCIIDAIKKTKLKDGKEKIWHLLQRIFNRNNNVVKSKQARELT